MGITSKTRKMLWGKSGNRCAMPDCKKELVVNISEINNHSIIGEECHIIAQRSDGPRGNRNFDTSKIDDYDNLILMCGDHHTIIDDKSNLALYTVEELQNIKKEHENWVLSRFTFEDKKKLDDDLFYSEYIDKWVKLTYLIQWKEWTYYLINSDIPSLYVDVNDSLEELKEYTFRRIWPNRYKELENAFLNFVYIVEDFLFLFHRHANKFGTYYQTEKFHKSECHHDQKIFNDLFEQYEFHRQLVQDLVFELTRAANYINEMIRKYVDSSFWLNEGRIVIQTGDMIDENMNIYSETLYLCYKIDELYCGLEQFKEDRINRNYFIGIGNNSKDKRHLKHVHKHNYEFLYE